MKTFINIFALVMLTTLCGCGTSTYVLKSEPTDAEVTIDGKMLGKTPLTVPMDQLTRDRDHIIVFNKEGLAPTKILMPSAAPSFLVGEITVPMEPKEPDSAKLNRLSLMLWKAQRLSGQERYSEALQVSQLMLNEEPKLVSALLLRASIFFLSKNLVEAESEWKKVLEIDPANEDAARAIRILRGGGKAGT